MRDILTVPEAATILKIDQHAVRIAIRRGTLAAERIGRDYLLDPREVERYGQERMPSGPRKQPLITP